MKNNSNYNNITPFTNLTNEKIIESTTIHYDKDNNNENSNSSKLAPIIGSVSILGIFSYYFAPELLMSAILPLGGVTAMASCFIYKK